MKLPFPAALLACALCAPAITYASDAALTDTLKAFTQCDAGFFDSLNTHRDTWKAYAPLEQDKATTWIAVKNRGESDANIVAVNPPSIAGLKLLSYFDQSSDLGQLGHYYYWGFIVEGGIDEVAKHVAPLMSQPTTLQNVGGAYVRSELKMGDRWQLIVPKPGTAPGTQNVERVLLVEPEGKQGKQSRISCSLQGAVNAAMLVQLRPDIAPAEYPTQRPDISIDSIPVPPAVLTQLNAPLLQPKFKTLSYTYVDKNSPAGKARPVTVEYTAEGGLLKSNEIYSTTFHVERLTLADLIQAKGKMNGIGDESVAVTQHAEVSLPQNWNPGQTLSARLSLVNVPAKPNGKPQETVMNCTVGQRYPAKQIFAELTGDAIELQCDQGYYKTTRAFIEDLGISLTLDSVSDSTPSVYQYTALKAVR
ncbi:hypothetical protein DYL59_21825 [Pseudomonas kairouanensis]|uniref:Uncharacterized protein n=1 Tax=Pseudomonas kairouanensis TaxID=2293832 RepID=A0A4Z0AJK0_9PSED|nr:hypothetical protein [Pseudomonas kairouanensis]TFY86580.1 hypothetical protein DYL59_21825 [Pseudomonas kairouanensis]